MTRLRWILCFPAFVLLAAATACAAPPTPDPAEVAAIAEASLEAIGTRRALQETQTATAGAPTLTHTLRPPTVTLVPSHTPTESPAPTSTDAPTPTVTPRPATRVPPTHTAEPTPPVEAGGPPQIVFSPITCCEWAGKEPLVNGMTISPDAYLTFEIRCVGCGVRAGWPCHLPYFSQWSKYGKSAEPGLAVGAADASSYYIQAASVVWGVGGQGQVCAGSVILARLEARQFPRHLSGQTVSLYASTQFALVAPDSSPVWYSSPVIYAVVLP